MQTINESYDILNQNVKDLNIECPKLTLVAKHELINVKLIKKEKKLYLVIEKQNF